MVGVKPERRQPALTWHSSEDEATILTAGNTTANTERRGYLSVLALYNLIQHETNPAVRAQYQTILKKWWALNRNEDNPLYAALALASTHANGAYAEAIRHNLALYAEDRKGFGASYWEKNGVAIAEAEGGGAHDGYSREPLPFSLRPKDAFLSQRNSRRLKGDHEVEYPPTDYLFVYWLCRAHGILAAPKPTPIAERIKG
jgi:hypothetical protein